MSHMEPKNRTADDLNGESNEVTVPSEPEPQSQVIQSVQDHVNQETESEIAERRKRIFDEAKVAVEETRNALAALDVGDRDNTIGALTNAIGKLEMLLARNPSLALAPVEVKTVVRDTFAGTASIKPSIEYARKALSNGEVQKARGMLANLASEVSIQTTCLPLATYPLAIKAAVPMIDAGRTKEAKMALQTVLGTLVVTEDIVIPLPVVRSRAMLKEAKTLAENATRNDSEEKRLKELLEGAKKSLELAELLGYGRTKSDYKELFEQLKEVEKDVFEKKSGKNIFDEFTVTFRKLFDWKSSEPEKTEKEKAV
ncbi:MAG: YfdX family protein [Magnetococcales bacterium]|nr:YfdX family protein [Magnetococcales bacterium]MBF0438171.1 YfdX family protein [Magnetococcales bacterium]